MSSLGPFDLDYPQLLFVAFALCVAVALVAVVGTSSASFGAYNAGWDGATALEGEANAVDTDAQVIRETAAYGEVPVNGTIAVVLAPDEPYDPEATGRLNRFVRNGGTLLVADDYGSYTNPLLADLGVGTRLDGRTLRDEQYYYRSPALPVARNVVAGRYTRDVNELTLNHGTAVRRTETEGPNGTRVLVNSSAFAYLDRNSNGRLDGAEAIGQHPVAVAERVGRGEVLVVSDPSVFINAMVERPGNRAFVRTVFAEHERVLIDGSHTTRLPPIAIAVLVIRDSPLLQVLVGAGALGLVGGLARRPGLLGRARSWLGARTGRRERNELAETNGTGLDPAAIEAYLAERHPDWDGKRVRRVTKGINTYRDNPPNND